MRNKMLLLMILVGLSVNAQLTLLDEPLHDGIHSGNILSMAIYDNDILYTMTKNTNTGIPGVFLSNGTNGDRIELLDGTNSSAYFNATIAADQVRLYGNGNYRRGKDIYTSVNTNGNGVLNTYRFNKSKTALIAENIFRPTTDFSRNINLVANDGLITMDTINVGEIDNPDIRIEIHHFKKNGAQIDYTLPDFFFGESRPSSFFDWKDRLFFTAKILGETNLYKIDGLGITRVTENKVTKPTAFKGVSPFSFLLDDENFIYFIGRDGFYTNVVPGPFVRNFPVKVCYTDGTPDFGSTDTDIRGLDDGSLGYSAFPKTERPTTILGALNDNIIYYSTANNGVFFTAPTNLSDQHVLGIPNPRLNRIRHIEYDDKIFIGIEYNFSARLYTTNGIVNQTVEKTLPLFPGTVVKPQRLGSFKENNGKIYVIATYNISGSSRYLLLSYDKKNSNTVIELEFPSNIFPNIELFDEFNNGFVFRCKVGSFFAKKTSLYTWNTEHRAEVLSLEGTSESNQALLSYNGNEYSIKSNATIFDENDQLKVQVLDFSSIPFKHIIKELPANIDERRFSRFFYTLNTLKSGNNHQSNLTLSFDSQMFRSITPSGENLSVMAFYNDTWTEIRPVSFDNALNTITINQFFPDEAFLFLKDNGTLSTLNIKSKASELQVYPNPTTNKITVSLKNNQPIQKIILFNPLGTRVKEMVMDNVSETSVDLSSLSKGVYFLHVKTKAGSVVKKIIKN